MENGRLTSGRPRGNISLVNERLQPGSRTSQLEARTTFNIYFFSFFLRDTAPWVFTRAGRRYNRMVWRRLMVVFKSIWSAEGSGLSQISRCVRYIRFYDVCET